MKFEIRHLYTGELYATISAPSAPDALDLYCASQELTLDSAEVSVLPDGSATTPFSNYEIVATEETADDPDLNLCETCGHGRDVHTFFGTGEPAPSCWGHGTDTDGNCDCEAFVLFPKA